MLIRLCCLLGLVLGGKLQARTLAPAEIRFSAMAVPVYMEANGSGALYSLHQTLLAKLPIRHHTIISPPVRADHIFNAGQADALVPDFCNVQLRRHYVRSIPFARVVRHIFTPPGQALIRSYEQLKGKRVGLVRGYVYALQGPAGDGVILEFVADQRQALRMLISQRLDAIIADAIELQELAQADQLPMPGFDASAPVLDRSLCYTFVDNDLGRQLAQDISAAILQMRNSGELDRFLGPAGLPRPLPQAAPNPPTEDL